MMKIIRLFCVLVASLTAIVAFLLQIGVVPSSKARPTLRRVPLHHRFGDATSSYFHSRKSVLSLYPGELPGYTGWARTDQTLAGNFVIQGFRPAIAGREWFVDVPALITSVGEVGQHSIFEPMALLWSPGLSMTTWTAPTDSTFTFSTRASIRLRPY